MSSLNVSVATLWVPKPLIFWYVESKHRVFKPIYKLSLKVWLLTHEYASHQINSTVDFIRKSSTFSLIRFMRAYFATASTWVELIYLYVFNFIFFLVENMTKLFDIFLLFNDLYLISNFHLLTMQIDSVILSSIFLYCFNFFNLIFINFLLHS